MIKYYAKENLAEIADGDQDFLKILAQTFLEEIPPDLYSMKEAIDALKDITSIEAWSKTSKNKATVLPHLESVLDTLNHVFDELREDFKL